MNLSLIKLAFVQALYTITWDVIGGIEMCYMMQYVVKLNHNIVLVIDMIENISNHNNCILMRQFWVQCGLLKCFVQGFGPCGMNLGKRPNAVRALVCLPLLSVMG